MGPRTLDMMRWCLVPYWAKDIKVSFANINAMAETVDTKRAFRDAFARRRCLVPTIEAVYELEEARTEGKQPSAIALASGGLMASAAPWRTGKLAPTVLARARGTCLPVRS